MKALVISIGTGTGEAEAGVESLVSGILFSIRSNNPNKIFFVTSKDSEERTLPKVLQNINLPYETVSLSDLEDVDRICEQLSPKIRDIKKDFDSVTVDYTSGTKAMSAALAIVGSWQEVDALSYVTGKRHGGIVIKGTERLLTLRPYQILTERKFAEAVTFFNKCQFDTSLLIIAEIERKIPDPALSAQLLPFKNAALAYSAWDKFDHGEAIEKFREVKLPCFNNNKAFLNKLYHSREKGKDAEPFYIADLINNARRRGNIERKYDDAVARLYRTIELIAQYRLKKYGIEDTSDIPADKIPPELAHDFRATSGKIKIGLEKAYQLLAAKGDDLGTEFAADKALRGLLSERNKSILAHGLKPVTKQTYHELLEKTRRFASSVVSNFDELVSQSGFIEWPHSP